MAVPESTKDYLLKVQREIGRLTLARLDEQLAIAASKAPAKRPARVKKPATPPAPGSAQTNVVSQPSRANHARLSSMFDTLRMGVTERTVTSQSLM
jgi:hypothetical protein